LPTLTSIICLAESGEDEPESFISTKTKGKKKRTRKDDEEDSDSEPPRPPLAENTHHNRHKLRLEYAQDQALEMPPPNPKKTKTGSKKNPSKSARNREENDDDYEEERRINGQMTQKEEDNFRAQMRLHAMSVAKNIKVTEAMLQAVKKATKRELWKTCKFIKNEAFLHKATNFVMNKLQLAEMDGKTGKLLIKTEEIWKEVHKDTVREAMNKQRNYVNGEVQKFVFGALCKDRTDIPNIEEIKDLALREKLDDKTDDAVREDMEKKFVVYVSELLPRVAGATYWGPGNRNYHLPSSHMIEQDVPQGSGLPTSTYAVTESDEAYLVVMWENFYDKWTKQVEKYKQSVEDHKEDPNVPLFSVKNDKTDYECEYTNAKAGSLKYGGWRAKGIEEYDKLCAKIKKNRVEEKKYLRAVEKVCLVTIQKNVGILSAADEEVKGKKPQNKSEAAFADVDAGDDYDFATW
jgi:hypothetical protein